MRKIASHSDPAYLDPLTPFAFESVQIAFKIFGLDPKQPHLKPTVRAAD
jgi:hypothetical protein